LKKTKSKHPVRELLYRIRTEGDTPGRQAGAVGVGVFIGCTPFYGLHLPLCVVFARIFRLNQILTYLAAHVSLPGVWPLLVIAELQVGRLLRGAPLLSIRLADIRHLDLKQFGVDLLLGSSLVGLAVAVPLAFLTLLLARRAHREPLVHGLIEEAARPYLEAGMFDWEFARGKLRHDPLYLHLLRRGLLPSEGLLLDLGCGRALLPALLVTAKDRYARGLYPEDWAPPPSALRLHGIEGRPKAAAAARLALGDQAVIETADLRQTDFPAAHAVLLLDVLHYLPTARALEPGGVLFIRDADAAGGWRFTATRIQERLASLARRDRRQHFHFRSTAQWRDLLAGLGLQVDSEPMSMGTPYANVLIRAWRL
jgi:uncharacterized protein (DUF2062 family)/SAM-dependent methyltransferase